MRRAGRSTDKIHLVKCSLTADALRDKAWDYIEQYGEEIEERLLQEFSDALEAGDVQGATDLLCVITEIDRLYAAAVERSASSLH